MSRLVSVFGPTLVLFGVFYLFAEITRLWGEWRGMVNSEELADRMSWNAYHGYHAYHYTQSERYKSNLRTWIRGH